MSTIYNYTITRALFAVSLALFLVILCLSLLDYTLPAQADSVVRYVSVNDPNCGGQNPCYTNIQAALDAAMNDDIIKVATGVYTGVQARLVGTQILTQVVLLHKSVVLQGGYTTTNWDNSLPFEHPTIIDAQSKGRVVYVVESITATVEGFTITNGNASGLGGGTWEQDVGGGIFAKNTNLTLLHNSIFSNTSGSSSEARGGGVYAYGSSQNAFDFSSNLFISNTSGGWGGGLALRNVQADIISNTIAGNKALRWGGGGLHQEGGGQVLIADNLVQDNAAGSSYHGGGMYIGGSNIVITANMIMNNSADTGGGIRLNYDQALIISNTITGNTATQYGGGISLYNSGSVISDNLVLSNTASGRGGGIHIWFQTFNTPTLYGNTIQGNSATSGGGIDISYAKRVTLITNTIAHNSASSNGGGLWVSAGGEGIPEIVLDRCSFIHNTAGAYGGGLYSYSSTVTLNANLIQENSANDSGGGLWIEHDSVFTATNSFIAQNQANSVAGALYVWDSKGTLLQNTIADNNAGTVYDGIVVATGATAKFTNTILVSHAVGMATTGAGATIVADHTLWWATATYTDSSGGGLLQTRDDIFGDPVFVSGSDYHITGTSSALNAGANTKVTDDIDGEQRPMGSGYDIGADEYTDYLSVHANFTALPTSGVAPLTVVFTNTSTGDYDNSVWSFGGGITSTLDNPTYTYTVGDIYTVTLTISGTGGIDTITRTNYITVFKPLASVNVSGPVMVTTYKSYSFTAAISPSNTAMPIVYRWEGTDQQAVTQTNMITDATSFTWETTGIKTITVTTSNEGSATSNTFVVTVERNVHARGGIVSGTWDVAGSPYLIVTDTIVPENHQLTIEPGVEVRFNGHYRFTVYGTLLAQGTATDNIIFTRNHPTDESRGWGIRFDNASAEISILSFCLIEYGYSHDGVWGATPDDKGGGVHCLNCNLIVENCYIRNNTANVGGGIFGYMYQGQRLIIRNNLIENNSAFCHGYNACGGGGIAIQGGNSSTVRVENNRIIENSYTSDGPNLEGGGGIQLDAGSGSVVNNTIYGNSSSKGSGIHTVAGYSGRIVNNIVWGNTGSDNDDQITIETGYEPGPIPEGLAIHYNDIQDAAIVVVYRNTPQGIAYTDGIGNINSDPIFVDVDNGDFHLSSDSPCINVGTHNYAPSFDMDGEPRPMGSGYDIGADEYTDVRPGPDEHTIYLPLVLRLG